MARRPRLDLPGFPLHVIQRGNNRLPCFFTEEDYIAYGEDLGACASVGGVSIHAYVLMTNHVHLLVSGSAAGAVSWMMQAVGRRYVRYINRTYRRSGTLWEGRFKSSLVDSERYVMTCYRYIEFNPVRARMVDAPGKYRWSSHRHNAHGMTDPIIQPHGAYLALGADVDERSSVYRELCNTMVSDEEIAAIRAHLEQERALGSRRFQAEIATTLARCVHLRGPGRPKKAPGNVL